MDKYKEIKQQVVDESKNVVWLRNKIELNERNGSITYQQKEELLNILYNRYLNIRRYI